MLKLTCFNVLQQVVHMAAVRCLNGTGYAVNKMKSGVKVWQCHCDVSSSQLLSEKCSTGVAAVNILLAQQTKHRLWIFHHVGPLANLALWCAKVLQNTARQQL